MHTHKITDNNLLEPATVIHQWAEPQHMAEPPHMAEPQHMAEHYDTGTIIIMAYILTY